MNHSIEMVVWGFRRMRQTEFLVVSVFPTHSQDSQRFTSGLRGEFELIILIVCFSSPGCWEQGDIVGTL